MRRYLRSLGAKIAPTAYTRLKKLSILDDNDSAVEVLLQLRAENLDLQAQIDEIRREHRRVVELYDLVFERLQRENPLRDRV